MQSSHILRAVIGLFGFIAAVSAHGAGAVETTFTLTGLVVKDAAGNVVPTVLAPTSIAQNSYSTSYVYTHGLIDANGDYLEIADYRRHFDLMPWSTHFTVPPGTDMSAKATTSGGFFNTLTANAFANEFNASVNAYSEVIYDIFLPANGSVTVSGTMSGHALSTGQPTGLNNVPHVAGFDTYLIFSPQFIPGEVYRITDSVSSALAPYSPDETFQSRSFAQTFVNPIGLNSYAHIDMIASAHVGNGALASAIPEPATWLMSALGVIWLAALTRYRRG